MPIESIHIHLRRDYFLLLLLADERAHLLKLLLYSGPLGRIREGFTRLRRGTSTATHPLLLGSDARSSSLVVTRHALVSGRTLRLALRAFSIVIKLLLKLIKLVHEIRILATVHSASQDMLHDLGCLFLPLVMLAEAASVVLRVVDAAGSAHGKSTATLRIARLAAAFTTRFTSGASRVLAS